MLSLTPVASLASVSGSGNSAGLMAFSLARFLAAARWPSPSAELAGEGSKSTC